MRFVPLQFSWFCFWEVFWFSLFKAKMTVVSAQWAAPINQHWGVNISSRVRAEEYHTIHKIITGNCILILPISSINSSYSLAQCMLHLKLELRWCSSETIEKPSQNQNAFIIVFRQVVIIYDPKLFSKLIFRFSLSMWSVAS